MSPDDRRLLERWLNLIARFTARGWVTETEAIELRARALSAMEVSA